ncbi:hypothetical protein [Mycobacterium gallinarum]|nr:hypothetical protein [Mycobacterium gallinarum]
MPPHAAVPTVRRCRDCSTRLLRTNTTTRCAECRLMRRNERLTTPDMAERRDALLRTAAIARRTAELDAEIYSDRGRSPMTARDDQLGPDAEQHPGTGKWRLLWTGDKVAEVVGLFSHDTEAAALQEGRAFVRRQLRAAQRGGR